MGGWSWKELENGPLFLHSYEISCLLTKWKEIFSPALSKVMVLYNVLWAQSTTPHVLLQSRLNALYISDSPLSKPLVCCDHDTLLLKKLQWLPIAYGMEDKPSLAFKDLHHLASIISTQIELLLITRAGPELSCFHDFTESFPSLEIPFSFFLPYLYPWKFDLGPMTHSL